MRDTPLVFAATLTEIIVAWPLSFLLGVLVGLLMASRYRIVRARDPRERNGAS